MSDIIPFFGGKVAELENCMFQMRPAKIEETEGIYGGVYLRTVYVPKNTIIIGATHRCEHFAIMSGGRMLIADAKGVAEYVGFNILKSVAGVKRVGFAIEDTIFSTIHPTSETDCDKVVEIITDAKADELLNGANNLQKKLFEAKRKSNYAQIKQQHKTSASIEFQQLCLNFD